ncbi:hypothetical protein PybrP1_001120 [[Pythium] brassicae (nom. inval.)]|nr:hypothetical protein PybrP1_001120 [[Pythium] brassicae (nom. inval.)]
MSTAGLRKHALLVLVAVLVATYQLYRLESQRARRSVDVNEEFERAARFLENQLAAQRGRYEVRITVPSSAAHAAAKKAQYRTALVISRHHAVPRIEAELFVDAQLVAERRTHKTGATKPRAAYGPAAGRATIAASVASGGARPTLRLRVYDVAAMDAIAKELQHKKLIASYETQ